MPSRDIDDQSVLQSDCPKPLWTITWELDFFQIRDLRWVIANNMNVHYKPNSEKSDDQFFQESQETLFRSLAHLSHFLANRNFMKNLFFPVIFILDRCFYPKFQETDKRILKKTGYRQTDLWTDKHKFVRLLRLLLSRQNRPAQVTF